jgi:hypothetical protein
MKARRMALKFEPTFASIPTVELGIISLVDQNLQDLYFSRPASAQALAFAPLHLK